MPPRYLAACNTLKPYFHNPQTDARQHERCAWISVAEIILHRPQISALIGKARAYPDDSKRISNIPSGRLHPINQVRPKLAVGTASDQGTYVLQRDANFRPIGEHGRITEWRKTRRRRN